MLHCLLLEELAVLALGDDLHCVILSCRSVETVPEGFAYDRAPQSATMSVTHIPCYECPTTIGCLLL
jgi:hypothetical protein